MDWPTFMSMTHGSREPHFNSYEMGVLKSGGLKLKLTAVKIH